MWDVLPSNGTIFLEVIPSMQKLKNDISNMRFWKDVPANLVVESQMTLFYQNELKLLEI